MAEHVEIERKYLLASRPQFPPETTSIHIDQGYLPDGAAGRLRRITYNDESVRHFFTLSQW